MAWLVTRGRCEYYLAHVCADGSRLGVPLYVSCRSESTERNN